MASGAAAEGTAAAAAAESAAADSAAAHRAVDFAVVFLWTRPQQTLPGAEGPSHVEPQIRLSMGCDESRGGC